MAIRTPAEMTALCCQSGVTKTRHSNAVLLLLAILAGAVIALGSATTNTAIYGIPDTWTARTICALLFPLGLGIVVVTGGELFTGNALIVVSVLEKKAAWSGLMRNWAIVYLGNLLGAALVAALCVYGGQLDHSGGALAVFTMRLAAAKCAVPFGPGLGLGVLCNLLVCLGVVMSMCAQDVTGKLLGAYWPVCLFVLCGFEHCVANMYYILAGLMAVARPEYAALAAQAGLDLSGLTLGGLAGNLIPVTLGNLLGGAGLGWLLWFCHLRPSSTRP